MSQIEHYCFEEHEEIRRAAVECLCNMAVNEEVCTNILSILQTRDIHTNHSPVQALGL